LFSKHPSWPRPPGLKCRPPGVAGLIPVCWTSSDAGDRQAALNPALPLALPCQIPDQIYQLFQASSEPVQLPDDLGITCAELLQGLAQTWSIRLAAAGHILENFFVASLF
jgi:hypothetical protein